MSGLFGSKKDKGVSVVADPYKDVREGLTSWLSGQIGKPSTSYEGQMVAPATAQENQSLSFLDQYANRGTPSTFSNAKDVINNTLTGGYDPATSPYYQAMKAEAAVNNQDTQNQIKSDAAGGGRFWAGARLQEQGRAATASNNALNTISAQLAESERNRQMQAVPLAQQLAETEANQPLDTAAALQTYGALPRGINQAQDTAMYNEWLRSTQEWPLNIAQLASGVQQAPMYSQGSEETPWWQKLLTGAASGGMSYLGGALGGLGKAKAAAPTGGSNFAESASWR